MQSPGQSFMSGGQGLPVTDTIEAREFEGILYRVMYLNQASGWGVIKIIQEPTLSIVTATGILCGLREGDRLRVRGDWVDKEPYGRQFQMVWCLPLKPETIKGIEEFLSSGFVRGMGRETVKRLIEGFGTGLIDVMENHPERLTGIKGIGRKKAGMISAAWEACYGMSDVMISLQSEGIPVSQAYRIFRFYGKDAARIIRENPYRLCFDVFGIGFRTADRIALSMGVSRESPGRARAGIVFALQEISERGHVCYPLDRLISAARGILDIPMLGVGEALEGLRLENEVRIENISGSPFVYLRSMYEAEDSVASFLKSLLDGPPAQAIPEIDSAVGWFEEKNGIQLAPEQKTALASALTEKMLVITGGPGTGKTTLVRGIIEVCERRGSRAHLCAPTGRAAKRLSEVTGREAKTIHRLFELNPLDRSGYED